MPRTRKNLDRAAEIRSDMAVYGIRRYQVAAALEVSEMTVYRWILDGPTDEHYSRIRAALDSIIERKGDRPHD